LFKVKESYGQSQQESRETGREREGNETGEREQHDLYKINNFESMRRAFRDSASVIRF
jgi:hypothetical protein